MSVLGWTEPSNNESIGVDHLGMRVAGEQAYSKLIDFNTTVAWRPRYYSFFCWLTRYAFRKAGGQIGASSSRVNATLYRQTIKQIEYAVATATLLADPHIIRIAGSTNILKNIEELSNSGNKTIQIKGDHLRAPSGGLSVYGGPMHVLGILASSSGVDVPLPGSIGERLADNFEASISQVNAEAVISCKEVEIDQLKEVSDFCALNNIADFAKYNDVVGKELQSLRDIIVDWGGFNCGVGPSARRILSIGLILECRKLLADEPSSRDRFCEITLLGAVRSNDVILSFDNLPPIYSNVLKEWQAYQIHAYTTYALEALLGVILSRAFELQDEIGDNFSQKGLIHSLLNDLPKGASESKVNLPPSLKTWWDFSLTELRDHLAILVGQGRRAQSAESELVAALEETTKHIDTANIYSWLHDAMFLLLFVQVRQSILSEKYGDKYWIGSIQQFRLPPNTMNKYLDRHIDLGETVQEYLRFVCDKLVLDQHSNNALRKLVSQPTQDTVKFIRQGPTFIPLSKHNPGTSDPRYNNTIMYLQDLGYLTYTDTPIPTEDGEALIQKIRDCSQ